MLSYSPPSARNNFAEFSAIRDDRDILVFAADLNKETNLISISYVDILPISDQSIQPEWNKT